MIQDIDDRYNPTWINRKALKEDSVFVFGSRTFYYKDRLPYASEVLTNLIYLFQIGDKYYYLSLESDLIPNTSIDALRHMEDRSLAFAISTAYHLYLWYKDKKYCPCCKNKISYGTIERRLECSCGYIEYPKISPAVIVGILHDDKILLTKYKEGYRNYALVAGYSEIGESFTDTIHREVYEEVGLRVKNIRYFDSQPWGMSGSLLAGFFCDVDGNPTPHADGVELGFAKFFSKNEIDLEEDNTTLTRKMILHFKNEM